MSVCQSPWYSWLSFNYDFNYWTRKLTGWSDLTFKERLYRPYILYSYILLYSFILCSSPSYCGMLYNILFNYTALLNAVERSVHWHGPSRLPVVNYFSIMAVAKDIMTAVKESGFISRLSWKNCWGFFPDNDRRYMPPYFLLLITYYLFLLLLILYSTMVYSTVLYAYIIFYLYLLTLCILLFYCDILSLLLYYTLLYTTLWLYYSTAI